MGKKNWHANALRHRRRLKKHKIEAKDRNRRQGKA
jgi:hypothetical protein